MPADEMRALSDDQIQRFVLDGFVRIDRAFPRELADEARAMLWRDTGCDPHDPGTWTKPVIRLSGYKDPPFLKAERTPVLRAAFDQIAARVAGAWGRWASGARLWCASRIRMRPATMAGTLIQAFPPMAAIRTSGART